MENSDTNNLLTVGGIYRPKSDNGNPLGCKYRILVMDEREVLYEHYFPHLGWAVSDHLKSTCNFNRMDAKEFSDRYGSNGVMHLTDREHSVIRPDLPLSVEVSEDVDEPDAIAIGTPRVIIEYFQPRSRRAKVVSITSSDPRGFSHKEALRKLATAPELNASGRQPLQCRLRRTGIRRQLPLYVIDEIAWGD